MTVVRWSNPVKQRQGGMWADTGQTQPTKLHVTRDGERTVCGYPIGDGAVVVAVTADWYEHANCYNCAYRLWPDQAPAGFVRPRKWPRFPATPRVPALSWPGSRPGDLPGCTPRSAVPAAVPLPRRACDEGNRTRTSSGAGTSPARITMSTVRNAGRT